MSASAQLQDVASLKPDGDLAALREHLNQIASGEAFKGSRRSAQFLAFIVEKMLDHQSETLKERTIGIELFGRPATYDTGEDAIVRVTATDVRRRLLQHYSLHPNKSEFRISLPTGGYVPEIERLKPPPAEIDPATTVQNGHYAVAEPSAVAHPVQHIEVECSPANLSTLSTRNAARNIWPKTMLAFAAGIVVTSLFYYATTHMHTTLISPWNVILQPGQITRVIASDPDISQIQELAHRQVSLSDYANENYGCEWISLQNSVPCNAVFRGDKFAGVDTVIIDRLSQLAQKVDGRVTVQSARSIRLPYLRTNDDYIFLGSPHSNPWVDLFSAQMDFVILFDEKRGTEIVKNRHPRPGEQTEYVPTAKGGGTGESFATVSLLRNPDQVGKILLLAGITAEGTQAAGDLTMNFSVLQSTLKSCGVDAKSATARYQILLRVETMANAVTQTSVIACHSLK